MERNTLTLLVVEDEPLVRWDTRAFLEDAGYSVRDASSAAQALPLLESAHINGLVTDVEMPGTMDGFELAQIARLKFPDMPVLVLSGRRSPASIDLPIGAKFVSKPYERTLVLGLLSRLFARR